MSEKKITEVADEVVDRWLVKVMKSKWSPFYLAGFWLSGVAVGHFGISIGFVLLEVLWFL